MPRFLFPWRIYPSMESSKWALPAGGIGYCQIKFLEPWFKASLINQLLDSRFVYSKKNSPKCGNKNSPKFGPARGNGYHALVVSNLPSVHLPWQHWCLTVITCQYAQNWHFNGELGTQKDISVTLVYVCQFITRPMQWMLERGGWGGVGRC